MEVVQRFKSIRLLTDESFGGCAFRSVLEDRGKNNLVVIPNSAHSDDSMLTSNKRSDERRYHLNPTLLNCDREKRHKKERREVGGSGE
jgi:hypothetical protein